MDSYNRTGGYMPATCAGGTCTGGEGEIPTLQDIANYNYMTPQQQNQQRQELSRLGSTFSRGLPVTSSRQMAPVTGTQMVPGATGQMAQLAPEAQGTQGMQAMPGMQPATGLPVTPATLPATVTGESLQYLNGFLRTQIGRPVKVDFLIGTNTLVDRTGILLGVGANYILINEEETDDIVACDFYNIKFVKFYY